MALVAIAGERWEVEFFEDGSVEVEKFVSNGDLVDKSALAALFQSNHESILMDTASPPLIQTVSFAD